MSKREFWISRQAGTAGTTIAEKGGAIVDCSITSVEDILFSTGAIRL